MPSKAETLARRFCATLADDTEGRPGLKFRQCASKQAHLVGWFD
jgi:hypothetical protein